MPPDERKRHDRYLTALRTRLDVQAIDTALAQGRLLSTEQAISEARTIWM